MLVTTTEFRRKFPEFISQEVFPGPVLQTWLDFAAKMLPEDRWSTVHDMGICFFAAHYVSLQARGLAAATSGKQSPNTAGPVSSKSIGPASVSYDTSAGIELGAGHWNETLYGRQFIRMAKMMGAGPLTEHNLSGSHGFWPGVIL